MKKLYDTALKFSEEKRSLKNMELVTAIQNYITRHLDSDLSVERLSEEFFISGSYMRKLFKCETNTTIKEYINNIRMSKAKELLENQNNKISYIASSIGYLSDTSFITAFRLNTGKTPGEYRSQFILKVKSEYSSE